MLGFSPLADSTLADDEKVVGGAPSVDENRDNFAFLLSGPVGALVVGAARDVAAQEQVEGRNDLAAGNITAGPPAVGASALECQHVLGAAGLATAPPVLDTSALAGQNALSAADITTAPPAVATADISVPVALAANGIVTGAPTTAGQVDTPGSIDAYARALQAEGLASSSSPKFQFSPDGTKYFVKEGAANGGPPSRYDLATPWDVTTGTLANSSSFNLTTEYFVQDFQLSDDGLYIAFLMWANSDGKSWLHLYSLAQPFVTNYTGTSSSAGSDDGYTFVRSVIIDQGFRNVKAFRHFGGKLYTVVTPTPVGSDFSRLQIRAANSTSFSGLGVLNNATVSTETLTTSVLGYSLAFLSLDGSSRIYHSNAAYDPLTLERLEVSGQTLGGNLRYQLKPDGIGILVPQLAEIDTDASVTIQQEGASAVTSLTAPAPVLGSAALDQNHDIIADALLSAAPELPTDLVQEHALGAEPLLSGAPELPAAVFQDHLLSPDEILANVLVPTAAFFQDHRTGSDSLSTGPPNLAATELGQDHAFLPGDVLTGAPVLGQADTGLLATADLAATELPDEVTASLSRTTTADLAATEASDVASIALIDGIFGSLRVTETPDGFAGELAARHTIALAATERPDLASAQLQATHDVTFGLSEAGDTAAADASVFFSASLGAVESPDLAVFEASERHETSLASAELPDEVAIRLNTSITLEAQSGVYGYQGFPAELITGQRFNLRTGSYALSGFDVQFSVSKVMYPQTGYYDVTGNETDLNFLRFLDIGGEVIIVSPEIGEVLVPVEDRTIFANAEDRAIFVPA